MMLLCLLMPTGHYKAELEVWSWNLWLCGEPGIDTLIRGFYYFRHFLCQLISSDLLQTSYKEHS